MSESADNTQKDLPPEPIRVLQLYSWEEQKRFQHTTAEQRLEWLDFIVTAAWAGAVQRAEPEKKTP